MAASSSRRSRRVFRKAFDGGREGAEESSRGTLGAAAPFCPARYLRAPGMVKPSS